MTTRVRLLVRADDIGSFSGVTPAVIDAARRGIVRNISMMLPTPWVEDAARALRALPGICIGVHLTICCEWPAARWRPLLPAARVPCLVDAEGCFKRDPGVIHKDGAVVEQVLAECQAQVDRARALGLPIRYVDTHMGWEWIHAPSGPPRAADLMPDFCRRNGLIWGNGLRFAPLPKVDAPGASPAGLLRRLELAAPGSYLVVTHPCLPNGTIATADLGGGAGTVQRERLDDYRLIADRELRHEFERRGVELISYVQAAA